MLAEVISSGIDSQKLTSKKFSEVALLKFVIVWGNAVGVMIWGCEFSLEVKFCLSKMIEEIIERIRLSKLFEMGRVISSLSVF